MHIQVDWLTISTRPKGEEIEYNHQMYDVRVMPYSTRQFAIVEEFYINNDRVATICRKPQSSALPSDCIMVKFDNSILYEGEALDIVCNFCDQNNLDFKAISRLDIAHDFQQFHNGWLPQKFIKQFLHNNIRKTNKGKYSLAGEHHYILEHQYLRFGSGKSAVTAYVYNKTREMQQVKKKPWIEQQWLDTGMIDDQDIWRLEFRITDGHINFVDGDTGQTISLKHLTILNRENLLLLFQSLVHGYFRFRKVSTDKNFNRWPLVELFRFTTPKLFKMRICEHSESSRADRIMIKKLFNFYDEMRGVDPLLSQSIEQVQSTLCYDRDLIKWTKQKQLNINPNLSKEPIK